MWTTGRINARRNFPSGTMFDLTRDCEGARPAALASFSRDGKVGDEDARADSLCTVLAWCAEVAGASPIAAELWSFAAGHGWAVGFGDTGRAGFILDGERSVVVIDAQGCAPASLGSASRCRLFADLIRALRDIWQDAHVPAAADQARHPEETLILERVRAADSATLTLAVAWELRCAGRPGVWRHLIGTGQGDLALAFCQAIEDCPAGIETAVVDVFRHWFADPARIDAADRQAIAMLEEGAAEFAASPAREDDPCDLIEALSVLPGGPCYLAGMGWAIRNDPAFSAIGSALTRTHLRHLACDRQPLEDAIVTFRDAALGRLFFPDAG